jgi:hypothetical protein
MMMAQTAPVAHIIPVMGATSLLPKPAKDWMAKRDRTKIDKGKPTAFR